VRYEQLLFTLTFTRTISEPHLLTTLTRSHQSHLPGLESARSRCQLKSCPLLHNCVKNSIRKGLQQTNHNEGYSR